MLRRMKLSIREPWVYLLLGAATAALFLPAVGYDFVSLDDGAYVFENPRVMTGLSWDNVRWAWTTMHFSYWIPLTWMSYMLDATLWGPAPGGFHFTNVLLHVVNALLLLRVLHLATGRPGLSALTAALFAIHPLRVESVAWVTERKDVLSILFWLLGTWAYLRYVERPGWRRYLPVTAAMLMGLMSKPVLMTFPVSLLLLDYWPLGRASRAVPGAWRRLVIEKLPLFALALAFAALAIVGQHLGGSIQSLETAPPAQRLGIVLLNYINYLKKILWPVNLAIVYPYYPPLPLGLSLYHLAILGGLTYAGWRCRRALPFVWMGWLWFLLNLAPVAGFLPSGSVQFADRFVYVPGIGLAVALVWGGAELARRRPDYAAAVRAAAVPALVACALLTHRQLGFWRDSLTVFRHAVAAVPLNSFAYRNLGYEHLRRGEVAAGRKYLDIMLTMSESAAEYAFVADSLAKGGHFAEALPYAQEAAKRDPDRVSYQGDLGIVLLNLGRRDEALGYFRRALAGHPGDPLAKFNLGLALRRCRQDAEAERHFTALLAARPDFAPASYELGLLLRDQGRLDAARRRLEDAVRLAPARADYRRALQALAAR